MRYGIAPADLDRLISDVHESLFNMNNTAYHLVVDGMLSGTGVRDAVEGGWLTAPALGIFDSLGDEISAWQQRYDLAHFRTYPDSNEVDRLDADGLVLRKKLADELSQAKVQYFSSTKMHLVLP